MVAGPVRLRPRARSNEQGGVMAYIKRLIRAMRHVHQGPNACPICGGPIPCLKH